MADFRQTTMKLKGSFEEKWWWFTIFWNDQSQYVVNVRFSWSKHELVTACICEWIIFFGWSQMSSLFRQYYDSLDEIWVFVNFSFSSFSHGRCKNIFAMDVSWNKGIDWTFSWNVLPFQLRLRWKQRSQWNSSYSTWKWNSLRHRFDLYFVRTQSAAATFLFGTRDNH